MSALLDALDAHNDQVLQSNAIAQALSDAGGDNAPEWVWMYATQMRLIVATSEALEIQIRQLGMGETHESEAETVLKGGIEC